MWLTVWTAHVFTFFSFFLEGVSGVVGAGDTGLQTADKNISTTTGRTRKPFIHALNYDIIGKRVSNVERLWRIERWKSQDCTKQDSDIGVAVGTGSVAAERPSGRQLYLSHLDP